ncbi:RNA-binding protein Musashi homolog 2 isoform X2 [Anthonomus grandis grandis]|uniref:RNA-binding protein Musashi homolog 2 isoform X2 n=1 Tax=Anthonomus grandis grandis TaxID=2921223 RepID=UPI002165CC10|nr:RNA-binding protein Musashi homolog 2 isoform X2 [Anthonomus grandis grandis]
MAVTIYPNINLDCSTLGEANGLLDSHHHDIAVINGSHSSSSGRSTPNGQNGSSDPAPGKLFVGGLSWQTSSEKLKEYFGMFGNVTDVLIMKDPVTQRSRGFGFITFSEPASVDKVLKVPIHTLDGKKIDPKHATPKNRPKQPNKTKKIFVGGVSQDTSADEVKAYFSQFGKVEEAVMLMDQQTKRHRGFGFVTFENEDVVDRVCEIHFHTIKNKKVECKKAQPKEAVQASAQLLGKRLMLSGLGVRLPAPVGGAVAAVNPLAAVQPLAHVQAAAAAAAAAQAQNAAVAGYGKLLYPHLAGYRYSPYPIHTVNAGAAAAAAAAAAGAAAGATPANLGAAPGNTPAHQAATTAAQQVTASPYQGYNLTNVDMSSFQGVDWGAMYGVGINGSFF